MSPSLQTAGRILLASMIVLATGRAAQAGAPFVTDDAETTDDGHYEINLGSSFTHKQGETGGTAFGVDANYGVTDHLEAHIFVPLAYDKVSGGSTHVGIGDVELGVKYHLADEGEWADWLPAIAVEPTIDIPAGAESHNLGTGSVHAFIPVWMSKKWDKLTVFGGGGFDINPGPNNRNWVLGGGGATYDIDENWTLGGEVLYTSSAAVGQKGGLGFNVGGVYNINDTYHVLFSVGRNFTNAEKVNSFSSYIGLQITF
jgi:hypothetical protein